MFILNFAPQGVSIFLTGQPKHNKKRRTYLKFLDTLRREIQNNENSNVLQYQIFVATFALVDRKPMCSERRSRDLL